MYRPDQGPCEGFLPGVGAFSTKAGRGRGFRLTPLSDLLNLHVGLTTAVLVYPLSMQARRNRVERGGRPSRGDIRNSRW